jgi:mRNA interferase MazF
LLSQSAVRRRSASSAKQGSTPGQQIWLLANRMASPSRGDVWRADLGKPRGHEQALLRPVVILQSDLYATTSTVVIVPFTTNFTTPVLALGVPVDAGVAGLTKPSIALCHQMRALDRRQLLEPLGVLPIEVIGQIEALVMTVLGLPL